MARKIGKLPNDVILIHYSKNGKVVSDLNIWEWYNKTVSAVSKAVELNIPLVMRVGTENMVRVTKMFVLEARLPCEKIRYKYGKRVFRIDKRGRFVGIEGKHYPKNFLGETNKILDLTKVKDIRSDLLFDKYIRTAQQIKQPTEPSDMFIQAVESNTNITYTFLDDVPNELDGVSLSTDNHDGVLEQEMISVSNSLFIDEE